MRLLSWLMSWLDRTRGGFSASWWAAVDRMEHRAGWDGGTNWQQDKIQR